MTLDLDNLERTVRSASDGIDLWYGTQYITDIKADALNKLIHAAPDLIAAARKMQRIEEASGGVCACDYDWHCLRCCALRVMNALAEQRPGEG